MISEWVQYIEDIRRRSDGSTTGDGSTMERRIYANGFGVVGLQALYHTIASKYSEIGLSHTLLRSELKRPRDTEGRLFFDTGFLASIGLNQATCVLRQAMIRKHLLLRANARK